MPGGVLASCVRELTRTEKCTAEAVAAHGGVEIALVSRRLGRRDAQYDKGRAVALPQQPRAVGKLGFSSDRAGALDARADCDLFKIDAEAGMALLPASLAIMPVLLTIDTQLGIKVLSS
jgi:hypothetical protein